MPGRRRSTPPSIWASTRKKLRPSSAVATGRAAWYGELTARLFDSVALRFRLGRVNPDNTVTDANDLEVYEPAIVIGSPKLAVILAWQFLKNPNKPYAPSSPGDVIYGKVFLQY